MKVVSHSSVLIGMEVEIMDSTPHVVDARYLNDHRVEVFFDDGKEGVVDLSKYSDKEGVFSPLSDTDYVRKFFIDLNTLCWPNGANIAPERLYEQIES
mgnify:CR=1 FL=1